MADLTATLLAAALQHGAAIPEPLARGVADAAALAVGHAPGGPRRTLAQLHRNLARVRPELAVPDARGRTARLDALVRENLRRYLRYYAEVLTLGRLSRAEVHARFRIEGIEHVRGPIERGTSVVGALGHMGNWDLAGAHISARGVRTVSVAERLEPEEVFRGFLRAREDLGLTIVPLERAGTLRSLIREARRAPSLVPLLADRDLGRHGVRVDLLGEPARVAPGPAALARALRAPLVAVAIEHERLTGARARAAGFCSGAGWGGVARITPVDTDGDLATVTQRWVDLLGQAYRARPTDWHMLQPVWEADLDPRRLRAPAASSERVR